MSVRLFHTHSHKREDLVKTAHASFTVFVTFSSANQLLAIKQFWARTNNAAVQKLTMPVSIMIYSIADISVKALQQKLFRLLQFLELHIYFF